jgi:hypothetical protein
MTDQDAPCPRPGAGVPTLYDSAIQRLFGAQLMLLSTLGGIPAPDVRERIRESVAVLDEIISDLRCALHAGGEGCDVTPRTEDASAAG